MLHQLTSVNRLGAIIPSVMGLFRRSTVLIFALCVISAPSSAQIIDLRDYRGKQIACVTSGLQGFVRSCGMRESYEYVFIGSIASVTEITDTEKRLQLVPEEVFYGNADALLTVTTSQGACFGEIQTGDKWLFYLKRDNKSKVLLLPYGSPSEPITDAQAEIDLLRRLAQMNDSGIIMGQVTQPIWNDNRWETSIPVPDYKIVAKQQADGHEYMAFTDSAGRYEFEPLPPGSYHLSADIAEGLWAEEGTAEVRPRSCNRVGFQLEPDGRISGRVTAADGKPAKYVQVVIVPESDGNLQFTSAFSDGLGRFEVKALHPGRYLVGVGIQVQPATSDWRSRVYYPGVRDRNVAVTIELGRAEKRTNVDFQLPSLTSPLTCPPTLVQG